MRLANISELLGKTITHVEGGVGDDAITFTTADGERFSMYHERDCCETVSVEDVAGDMSDLIGSPILKAEESTNKENPKIDDYGDSHDSFTWTFYLLATVKGYVTIRWYGASNGYYSEYVTFAQHGHGGEQPPKWNS